MFKTHHSTVRLVFHTQALTEHTGSPSQTLIFSDCGKMQHVRKVERYWVEVRGSSNSRTEPVLRSQKEKETHYL